MNRKILVVALSILFAVVLYAKDDKVKLTGYLLDNNCTAGHVTDKDFADQAMKHPTSCAKMEACEKAGYAVYADHKLYKLDDAGNAKAEEVLKNTTAAKGVKVKVEGTVEGDVLHVTKMTEVTG